MSRNFGIGSRDMFVAGRMILQRRSRNGFKTQHDYADRWRLFCSWASEQNVKKMENVIQRKFGLPNNSCSSSKLLLKTNFLF